MVKIKFGKTYYRSLKILIEQQPTISVEIERSIDLFKKNPQDTRLENHALRKQLEGKYAFSVTGDIRIVYEWKGKTTARFLVIGSHRAVYWPSLLQN